jgi:hypothetical protein
LAQNYSVEINADHIFLMKGLGKVVILLTFQ